MTALAADPLAIYESTAGLHRFGRGVAARTRGGRASLRGRSDTHSVRSGSRRPSWSGDDGPIGTGTASANDPGCTFDGVRDRNGTGQQGKDSRNETAWVSSLISSLVGARLQVRPPEVAPRERERVFKAKTSSVRQPSETTQKQISNESVSCTPEAFSNYPWSPWPEAG